jgi:hypothetical protein
MSSNLHTFCFIDNTNPTNKCEDKNYTVVYDNKGTDVYKVNYYNSPSSMYLIPGPVLSQPTNIGSTKLNTNLFNNNTQPYAHINHDIGNNTGKYRI